MNNRQTDSKANRLTVLTDSGIFCYFPKSGDIFLAFSDKNVVLGKYPNWQNLKEFWPIWGPQGIDEMYF